MLNMLEESQRHGSAPPFEFGDANIRDGAKEWLTRIKRGPASTESREPLPDWRRFSPTWRRAARQWIAVPGHEGARIEVGRLEEAPC